MKILLVGGGSGGPVAPLLAIANHIKKTHPGAEFLLVGTKTGPERTMSKVADFNFIAITSGKWRRYFSLKNIATPFLLVAGFVQSLKLLKQFKPNCVFGTGSFVQVPLVWAAWILKIPVVLHQQDLAPSLANKLCEFIASKITVTFSQSAKNFSSEFGLFYRKRAADKIVVTGNPFREELRAGDRTEAQKFFNLRKDLPTLLVLGGGTGAEFINNLILDSLPELAKTVQIIHSTGSGKFKTSDAADYHPYQFIDNMAGAFAAADIVLGRAGLSTLTELSNLKKISIIVPMPESHQEINGMLLAKLDAAIVVRQKKLEPENLIALIRKLLFAHELGEVIKHNIGKIMPHDANEKISEIIIKLARL
jgi:UDP-N-acetylglucosamine--N-acetylmuramyl-(pentapeptide) pyrophosphoryl-undecaprenol N-acetylglucosamine transferase